MTCARRNTVKLRDTPTPGPRGPELNAVLLRSADALTRAHPALGGRTTNEHTQQEAVIHTHLVQLTPGHPAYHPFTLNQLASRTPEATLPVRSLPPIPERPHARGEVARPAGDLDHYLVLRRHVNAFRATTRAARQGAAARIRSRSRCLRSAPLTARGPLRRAVLALALFVRHQRQPQHASNFPSSPASLAAYSLAVSTARGCLACGLADRAHSRTTSRHLAPLGSRSRATWQPAAVIVLFVFTHTPAPEGGCGSWLPCLRPCRSRPFAHHFAPLRATSQPQLSRAAGSRHYLIISRSHFFTHRLPEGGCASALCAAAALAVLRLLLLTAACCGGCSCCGCCWPAACTGQQHGCGGGVRRGAAAQLSSCAAGGGGGALLLRRAASGSSKAERGSRSPSGRAGTRAGSGASVEAARAGRLARAQRVGAGAAGGRGRSGLARAQQELGAGARRGEAALV